MKKIIIILAAFAMIGCSHNDNEEQKPVSIMQTNARAIAEYGGGYRIYEFEHEGHKYLFHYHGGMIHSESCPCKQEGGL